MDIQIDQFGRNKSKSFNNFINNDKSKKILESLAEIKNQLENKNFNPNINDNNYLSNPNIKNIHTKNLKLHQLHRKVELLEKKISNLSNLVQPQSYKMENDIEDKLIEEESIFHGFETSSDLDKGKSLLVLESQNESKIFKFYHFIFVIILMAIILILLTTYKLKINFLEIIKIFFSNFN